jgi:hypothetical protein
MLLLVNLPIADAAEAKVQQMGQEVIDGNKELLVGGLEHFYFSIYMGIMVPSDFHIFPEGLKPPTSIDLILDGIYRL